MQLSNLSTIHTIDLIERFEQLQAGPRRLSEVVGFYSEHEDDPWNSIDAIEAELVKRETEDAR